MAGFRLTYNSPAVLSFALVTSALFLINEGLGRSLDPILSLQPGFNWGSITDYLSLLLHTVGHANWEHLLGNMTLLLLIGPILEEKYGGSMLALMALVTALLTSIIHLLFFSHGVMGASGLVFMCIMLVSFVNVKEREIPLTFVLVFLLFVGQEVYNSFQDDNVSQFAHIMGGLCGSFFGFGVINWGKGKRGATEAAAPSTTSEPSAYESFDFDSLPPLEDDDTEPSV